MCHTYINQDTEFKHSNVINIISLSSFFFMLPRLCNSMKGAWVEEVFCIVVAGDDTKQVLQLAKIYRADI